MDFRKDIFGFLSKYILENNNNIIKLEELIYKEYNNYDTEYIWTIYNTICLFLQLEPNDRNNCFDIVFDTIKDHKLFFYNHIFESEILLESNIDMANCNDFEVEEGIYTCNKCKSTKTYSAAKQIRSADEGTTVFITCWNCNNKWTEN